MRVLAIALMITSLAVPALAQGDPSKGEANKAEEQKKKESEDVERAYKDMLKRTTREQPAKKTDPWESFKFNRGPRVCRIAALNYLEFCS